MILLDTSVAIPLRDGEARAFDQLSRVSGQPCISIITQVELINGLQGPADIARRRAALKLFLRTVDRIDVDGRIIETYERVVAQCGVSRPKILDRLIAATALAHDMPLATRNPRDFADVPGLRVEDWT